MDRDAVIAALTAYVVDEILEGDDEGLDANTPLLEWGVLNSLEVTRLVAFVEQRFAVTLGADAITSESFRNIASIADIVTGRSRSAPD